jgi:hypothetical protein
MPDSGAAALTDPRQAVAYLEEISPEMRGCSILDGSCEVLASTGEDADWQAACRQLLEDADSTAGEPVNHLHIATGDGEVFGVRHEGLVAVAVTERFVLASLMLFDLRTVLRDLAAS